MYLFFRCDVSTFDKVRELGEKVKSEVGTVTVLVNNAGIMPCKPLEAHDEATIKKIFDINVFAHFWVSTYYTRLYIVVRICTCIVPILVLNIIYN